MATLGWFYLRAGRLDEAIASSRASLKLSPDNIGTHYDIGVAMLRKGDNKAALAAMQEEPEEGWRLTGLAWPTTRWGKRRHPMRRSPS